MDKPTPALALLALLLSACTAISPPTTTIDAAIPAPPASACNAAPDAASNQFIVGYGSLMEDESRARASPHAGPALPIELSGFRRGWFERGTGPGLGTTFLGVVPQREGRLNAVAYRVDLQELASTDRRESSYCRLPVAKSAIRLLAPAAAGTFDGEVWIYVAHSGTPPAEAYPIVQSYVDVFLAGCLEQEARFGVRGFAVECVRTTHDWSAYWVNDRIYPRRPFIYQPRARQIDEILSAEVAKYWPDARGHR